MAPVFEIPRDAVNPLVLLTEKFVDGRGLTTRYVGSPRLRLSCVILAHRGSRPVYLGGVGPLGITFGPDEGVDAALADLGPQKWRRRLPGGRTLGLSWEPKQR